MPKIKRFELITASLDEDALDCSGDPMMTKQDAKDECDINLIMKRCREVGGIPVSGGQPIYGDFTDGADYAETMRRCTAAQQNFEQLPADLRAKFNNSVSIMIDWLSDPKNKEEAQKLGLLARDPDPKSVRMVNGKVVPLEDNTSAAAPAAEGAPAGQPPAAGQAAL